MFFKKTMKAYVGRFRDEVVKELQKRGVIMETLEGSSFFRSKKPFQYAKIYLEFRDWEPTLGCWVKIKTDQSSSIIPHHVPLCHPDSLYPYLSLRIISGDHSVDTTWPLDAASRVAEALFKQANEIEVANTKAREPEFLKKYEEIWQLERKANEAREKLAREIRA